MHARRAKKAGILALILAALLGVALFAACDSIDGAGPGNGQPTDPTPGGDPSQRGTMVLSPSAINLTVAEGGTGGGLFFFFDLAGGKPPFVWSNSWTQMGLLIPLDEQGLGYANRAKYIVRNFGGTGDDTITVRDQSGAIVTAKFTKTIEEPAAPTAPTIIPASATIACGSPINLIANGGTGTFTWSKTAPDSIATLISAGQSATLTSVDSPTTCLADTVVTVIVTSGGVTGTSAITISKRVP